MWRSTVCRTRANRTHCALPKQEAPASRVASGHQAATAADELWSPGGSVPERSLSHKSPFICPLASSTQLYRQAFTDETLAQG